MLCIEYYFSYTTNSYKSKSLSYVLFIFFLVLKFKKNIAHKPQVFVARISIAHVFTLHVAAPFLFATVVSLMFGTAHWSPSFEIVLIACRCHRARHLLPLSLFVLLLSQLLPFSSVLSFSLLSRLCSSPDLIFWNVLADIYNGKWKWKD